MSIVNLITLFAFVAQAHAAEVAANDMNDSQNSMDEMFDKLVDKLAARALAEDKEDEISSLHNADLDTSTLLKPGHLGMPFAAPDQQRTIWDLDNVSPMDKGVIEDSSTLADDVDQRESMLGFVLGLRGGAKSPTPMKSPMKAPTPMKSPMKAPTPMKSPMKAATPMKSPMKAAAPKKSPMKSAMKSPSVSTALKVDPSLIVKGKRQHASPSTYAAAFPMKAMKTPLTKAMKAPKMV